LEMVSPKRSFINVNIKMYTTIKHNTNQTLDWVNQDCHHADDDGGILTCTACGE